MALNAARYMLSCRWVVGLGLLGSALPSSYRPREDPRRQRSIPSPSCLLSSASRLAGVNWKPSRAF